jgi:hypothetical protein
MKIILAIMLRSVLFLIIVPEYIALYFYAFKSRELRLSGTCKMKRRKEKEAL